MQTITPRFERPGWVHGWSWPYLCVDTLGAAGASILNGQNGVELARADAWYAGWYSFDTVAMLNDAPGGEQLSALSAQGTYVKWPVPQPQCVGARAADGHWASCVNGVLWYDGSAIDASPNFLGVEIASNGWVATYSHEAPTMQPEWRQWVTRIYHCGVFQRIISHDVPPQGKAINADGSYVYGDTARVFLNEPTNVTVELTATVERQEFCPTIAFDNSGRRWAWSPVGAAATKLLVRVVDSTVGWLLQLPFGCSGLSVVYANGAWQLCWHDATGRCAVADVNLQAADAQPLPVRLTPPVEPPRVTMEAQPITGTSPLTVNASLTKAPTSGPVTAIRYLLDGAIVESAFIWNYGYKITAAGLHTVAARVAGPGGQMTTTPQNVTVLPVETFSLGLNATFGEPTFDDQMQFMVDKRVQSVRTTLQKDPAGVVAQLGRYPSLAPLYILEAYDLNICRQQLAYVPDGSTVEFGNEDLNGTGACNPHPKMSAAQYAQNATTFKAWAEQKHLTVYWGAIGNLGRDLTWLREVLRLCPWMSLVSVHWYPTAMEMPSEQNILDLKLTIGTRHFRVTEFGCLCGPKAITHKFLWWKWYTPITEKEQLAFFVRAKAFWKAVPNCDGIDWYQHRSGAEATSYGLNGPTPQEAPRLAWDGYTA